MVKYETQQDLNIFKKIARLTEWFKARDLSSHNLEGDCVGSNPIWFSGKNLDILYASGYSQT